MFSKEIEVNLVVFLLAGFVTTSTALSYCFYLLTKYPIEMEKLQEEIDMHFGNDSNTEPDCDNIKNLAYLDMFIKETLRFYPVANSLVL